MMYNVYYLEYEIRDKENHDHELIMMMVKMTHNDLVQHQLAGIYSMNTDIGDSGTYHKSDVPMLLLTPILP